MFTDLTALLTGDNISSVPYKTKNIRPNIREKLFIGRLTDLSQLQAPKTTWLWLEKHFAVKKRVKRDLRGCKAAFHCPLWSNVSSHVALYGEGVTEGHRR